MKKGDKAKSVRRSAVSKARTYEEMGAFWDAHDLADVTERLPQPAAFEVELRRRRFLVAVDPEILRAVRQRAAGRGISAESLVNLWLKEKLAG